MGKVVSITTARKHGQSRATLAEDQEPGGPRRRSWARISGQFIARVALSVVKALSLAVVELLLSVLVFFRRPARFICKVGIIALLFMTLVEILNHWQDKKIIFPIVMTCFGLLLFLGFYDRFIEIVRRIKWLLNGGMQ